jgi:Kae1-associated kinase Bud32
MVTRYRGAEAILSEKRLFKTRVLVKERIKKYYRLKQLDEILRSQRTRREARLLHKAKLAGVMCPTVLEVSKYRLLLSFLDGKKFKTLDRKKAFLAGKALAKLHRTHIIHGDFTPANLLFNKDNIFVIDFGLGFFSHDVEDKAVDVLTMLKSLNDASVQNAFIRGYRTYVNHKHILKRLDEIKKRVRYA